MTVEAPEGSRLDAATPGTFLGDALDSIRTHAKPAGLAFIALPAPQGDALSLWRSEASGDAWFWQEPQQVRRNNGTLRLTSSTSTSTSTSTDGVSCSCAATNGGYVESGVGSAVPVWSDHGVSSGAWRFALQELWRGAVSVSHPSVVRVPAPRAVGGFGFHSEQPCDPAWRDFGSSRFVLPRWRYTHDRGGAALTFAIRVADIDAAVIDQALREHARLIAWLSSPLPLEAAPSVGQVHVQETSMSAWRDLVMAARDAIVGGQFNKVVTARRTRLSAAAPFDPVRVLAALAREQPEATVFGMRAGSSTFVGATPETLVERDGMRVRTEALAGTAPGGERDGARLLASTKDRHEQAIVVDEIVARLSGVCASVEVPAEPRARRLGHITHLRTPIEGELLTRLHVLDLVHLLHPTPAVAGFPRGAALQWIAEHEPDARGWYAGPIGWCNEQGDGRFVVGIRSALLRGNEAIAYAGAGIVAASDPTSEYEETRWKLRAVTHALVDQPERGHA